MDELERRQAAAAAEELLSQLGIDTLPIDVFEIAERLEIPVMEKSDTEAGVSGALLKVENHFAIAFATYIQSPGFRRFSIAHEIGHLHIPGHANALLPPGKAMHASRAGFRSDDPYERQADEFAANLLMPKGPFLSAMRNAGDGLEAILTLADLCETSRLATAIRYVNLTNEAMAIVVSEDQTLRYAFMSDEFKEFRGIRWLKSNSPLPDVPTAEFNRNPENIETLQQDEFQTPIADWFGGHHTISLREEVIGLGRYGRTLTILTSDESPDEADEDAEFEERWTPRFKR